VSAAWKNDNLHPQFGSGATYDFATFGHLLRHRSTSSTQTVPQGPRPTIDSDQTDLRASCHFFVIVGGPSVAGYAAKDGNEKSATDRCDTGAAFIVVMHRACGPDVPRYLFFLLWRFVEDLA
jgi:hypothetical protein